MGGLDTNMKRDFCISLLIVVIMMTLFNLAATKKYCKVTLKIVVSSLIPPAS